MSNRIKDKIILSEEDKKQIIEAFDSYNDSERREKIYKECRSHFYDLKMQGKSSLNEDELKLSCLLLANFLAVWGMQRNSFLMENDYHIFENVVKIIFKDDYNLLWNSQYDIIKSKKEDFINNLISIRDEINETLKCYLGRKEDISQILITKILLGTVACCPAYDTNFCKGLPQGKDFYSNNSVRMLVDFVCDNDIFKELADKRQLDIMKVVDMVYFKIGEKRE